MRRALAPRSLRPTRESERTSMRLAGPSGVMRTTTSSLKPKNSVVAVASMRSACGSAATIFQPSLRAAARQRSNATGGRAA